MKFEIVVLFEHVGLDITENQHRRLSSDASPELNGADGNSDAGKSESDAADTSRTLVSDALRLTSPRKSDSTEEQSIDSNGSLPDQPSHIDAAVTNDSQTATASPPSDSWSAKAYAFLADLASKVARNDTSHEHANSEHASLVDLPHLQQLLLEWNHQ